MFVRVCVCVYVRGHSTGVTFSWTKSTKAATAAKPPKWRLLLFWLTTRGVCVCVCETEIDREREREKERDLVCTEATHKGKRVSSCVCSFINWMVIFVSVININSPRPRELPATVELFEGNFNTIQYVKCSKSVSSDSWQRSSCATACIWCETSHLWLLQIMNVFYFLQFKVHSSILIVSYFVMWMR